MFNPQGTPYMFITKLETMTQFLKIIYINSQSGYHPYEIVGQVAIVLENILLDLNVCHI
jgi:hypothetical protein